MKHKESMIKNNQKGFSAVEVLIILAVIGLIGFIGWFVYQKQNTDKENPNQQITKNQTITEIVASINEKVGQEVSTARATGAEEGNYNGYISYKVAGYDYFSTVETKVLANYTPKDPAEFETEDQEADARKENEQTLGPVRTIIQDALQENGFRKVANYPTKEIIGDGEMYERADDVCAVNINWLAAGIGCATKEELTNVAKEVKPYVEAFRAANNEEPTGTAFGLLHTGTGSTDNDKFAILSTGIAGAYFYQQGGKWVYFTSSQEGIGCPDIVSNSLAAKAFSKVCREPGEGL